MLSSGYAIFWLLHSPIIASSCLSIPRLLHCQVMAFSGLLLLGYCIFRLERCQVRAFSGLSILRLEHSLLYHCPVYSFRAFSVIASSASPMILLRRIFFNPLLFLSPPSLLVKISGISANQPPEASNTCSSTNYNMGGCIFCRQGRQTGRRHPGKPGQSVGLSEAAGQKNMSDFSMAQN
jgi:hypothetical protein